TRSNGRLMRATAAMLPKAHSTRRTATYFGETRSHWMPGGSIAPVRIFPFALCLSLPSRLTLALPGGVLRGDPAETLNDQPHNDHHQAAAAHRNRQPEDVQVTPDVPHAQLVHDDAAMPAQEHRTGVCAGLGKQQRGHSQERVERGL